MAKVSVIIITHNRSNLLGAAITSVLNQTFQDFEIIVVDDASKDNTGAVVQAFDDKRIRYIRHKTNKREAGARNTGVQNAVGEYIGFLDDDDRWLPEKLQRQVALLDGSPAVVGGVYAGFFKNRESGETVDQIVPRERGNLFQNILMRNWLLTPSTVLVRNECFKKVGLFDEGIAFGTDWDMWLRISRDFQFEYISEPLVNYSVHEDQLSNNKALVAKGREDKLRKYEQLLAKNSKNYSDWYHGLGVLYCSNGEMAKARSAFLKAVKIYPLRVKPYFGLLFSLSNAENFTKVIALKESIVAAFNEPRAKIKNWNVRLCKLKKTVP